MNGFRCRRCGELHDDLPMHYGTDAPALWFTIPEEDLAGRCILSSDLCLIDDAQANRHYFIVGNLEIPVIGSAERFSWDVWVSLSSQDFLRVCERWEQPGREREPPYFGWLNTSLPGYPETLNLKTMVHTREVGRRPLIELEPTDHSLAVEQRAGITFDRIQEIAEQALHMESTSSGS